MRDGNGMAVEFGGLQGMSARDARGPGVAYAEAARTSAERSQMLGCSLLV